MDAAPPERRGAGAGQLVFGPLGTRGTHDLGHRLGRFASQQAVTRLFGIEQDQAPLAQGVRQGLLIAVRPVRQHQAVAGDAQHIARAQFDLGPWRDVEGESRRDLFFAQARRFDLVGQDDGFLARDQHFGHAEFGGVHHGVRAAGRDPGKPVDAAQADRGGAAALQAVAQQCKFGRHFGGALQGTHAASRSGWLLSRAKCRPSGFVSFLLCMASLYVGRSQTRAGNTNPLRSWLGNDPNMAFTPQFQLRTYVFSNS
jgi:hypothetical protein